MPDPKRKAYVSSKTFNYEFWSLAIVDIWFILNNEPES